MPNPDMHQESEKSDAEQFRNPRKFMPDVEHLDNEEDMNEEDGQNNNLNLYQPNARPLKNEYLPEHANRLEY